MSTSAHRPEHHDASQSPNAGRDDASEAPADEEVAPGCPPKRGLRTGIRAGITVNITD